MKPANILIDKNGIVKLIDFGASKQLNTQKGGATTSTAISYTNGYAPREQMEQNYDKFGPWTDIYALGATLYNLLTNNKPPLPTDIDDDISEDKHLSLPLPSYISDRTKKFILWLMQTNRQYRPQSIEEINNNLDSLEVEVSSQMTDEETTISVPLKDTLKEKSGSAEQEREIQSSQLGDWALLPLSAIIICAIVLLVIGVLFLVSK